MLIELPVFEEQFAELHAQCLAWARTLQCHIRTPGKVEAEIGDQHAGARL